MTLKSQDKTIKMVGTRRFELSVMQTPIGDFYLRFEDSKGPEDSYHTKDFKLVSELFELKLQELEGN